MKTVILYGPQASGKTRFANEFCKLYGCKGVADELMGPNDPAKARRGFLTIVQERPESVPRHVDRVVSVFEALKELKTQA